MSKTTKAIAVLILISLIAASFSSVGITLFLAAIGGLIVFLGLWIENEADEEIKGEHLSSYTEDARKLHLKYKIGWWILMFGIVVEIGIAVYEAAHSEIEIRKIRVEAVKNDPMNQRVSEISAKILVKFAGTNFLAPNDRIDLRNDNFVILFENKTNMSGFNPGQMLSLPAQHATPFERYKYVGDPNTYHGVVIQFGEHDFGQFDFAGDLSTEDGKNSPERPTVRELLDKVKVLRIYAGLFKQDAQISGGEAWLTINSTIRRKFIIYPQGMDDAILRFSPSLGQNPYFRPLVFLATNSIP